MKQPLPFPKFLSGYLQHFPRKRIIANQYTKAIKFIAFLLLMSSATISEAQTTQFSYDVAGNRIKREIILQKSSSANIDTAFYSKPVTEMMGKMKITIYPNPTRGQLSVEIANIPAGASGEIKIYNIAGNIIYYQKTLGPLNPFDFSIYPTGIYVLYIKVGQNESKWKIIKQ
jgi:hypothetical protein